MSRLRLVRLAIPLGCVVAGFAEAATVQHSEPLWAYRVGTRAAHDASRDARGSATQGAVAEKPAPAAPTVVSFNAFSTDFALELEPNGRLASLEQRLDTAAKAYRGKIAGVPRSWVRLVLTAQGPSGIVFDGKTLYGIETGTDASAASETPAMFRLADVYFAPGELGCESAAAMIDGEQAVATMAKELSALAASGAARNLELGAVADFEFSQTFGANAEAALLTRLNNVDGIFSEQLGIQVSVAEIDIFTANDDPFTASAASALLEQVANYRGATPSQDALGLTHLLTGRDLDGTTAGSAYVGAVCARRPQFDTRSFGAGLSESRRGAVLDSLVAAHEIGHNFGAPHDGDANGACASTPPTFLMSPNINGSNQFSACSIEQMQAEIAAAACLTLIGPADMAVTMSQPAPALAGVSFTHTASIRNNGAEEAAGVVFTATTEPGLAITAAQAGGATCTVSPSSATCPLGAVGGGAARSVTLTMSAASPGAFDFTATVTANSDADASDNSETETVTVVPAVDLVWAAAATTVQINVQTTISATLENAADFAATSVAVTATFTPGLRVDQASLGGTACSIAGQAISCPPRPLAARDTVAFVLAATGTVAGNQTVTFAATANETDDAPSDNRRSVAVMVSAPAQASDGGGGGASSWLAVAALLTAYGFAAGTLRGRRRPT